MPKLKAQFLKVLLDNAALAPQDISADLDSVDIPNEYEEVDVTGFTETVVNTIPGMLTAPVELSGTFNSASPAGFFTVVNGIKGVYAGHTLTVQVGQNALPVSTDPEFEGEFVCIRMGVSGNPRGKLVLTASLRPFAGAAPVWGTVA